MNLAWLLLLLSAAGGALASSEPVEFEGNTIANIFKERDENSCLLIFDGITAEQISEEDEIRLRATIANSTTKFCSDHPFECHTLGQKVNSSYVDVLWWHKYPETRRKRMTQIKLYVRYPTYMDGGSGDGVTKSLIPRRALKDLLEEYRDEIGASLGADLRYILVFDWKREAGLCAIAVSAFSAFLVIAIITCITGSKRQRDMIHEEFSKTIQQSRDVERPENSEPTQDSENAEVTTSEHIGEKSNSEEGKPVRRRRKREIAMERIMAARNLKKEVDSDGGVSNGEYVSDGGATESTTLTRQSDSRQSRASLIPATAQQTPPTKQITPSTVEQTPPTRLQFPDAAASPVIQPETSSQTNAQTGESLQGHNSDIFSAAALPTPEAALPPLDLNAVKEKKRKKKHKKPDQPDPTTDPSTNDSNNDSNNYSTIYDARIMVVGESSADTLPSSLPPIAMRPAAAGGAEVEGRGLKWGADIEHPKDTQM